MAVFQCFTTVTKDDRLIDVIGVWSPLLAQTCRRGILPVNATVQLLGTSFHCPAWRKKDTSTFRVHVDPPNLIERGGLGKHWYVVRGRQARAERATPAHGCANYSSAPHRDGTYTPVEYALRSWFILSDVVMCTHETSQRWSGWRASEDASATRKKAW